MIVPQNGTSPHLTQHKGDNYPSRVATRMGDGTGTTLSNLPLRLPVPYAFPRLRWCDSDVSAPCGAAERTASWSTI